jgi:two-component sensor histidine kinase
MSFFKPIRPLLTGWLVSSTGWGFVALAMTANSIATGHGSFIDNIRPSVRDWLAWAIITPLLFRFVSRFPIDRKTWKQAVPVHFAVALLSIAAVHGWKEIIDPSMPRFGRGMDWLREPFAEFGPDGPGPGGGRPPHPPPFGTPFHPPPRLVDLLYVFSFEVPIYLMIISGAHSVEFYRRSQTRAAQLARARLQSLQAQLQPHFLFNTLNTIAGLVHEDPNKADTLITSLSDLLRTSMETSSETVVSLEHELQFIRRYFDIMRARYEDRLRYEFEIDEATRDALVPPLLLQPLVENAVRHGLEPRAEGGTVTVRTWIENNILHLRVSDNGAGLPDGKLPREGIGLGNTRARLTELYGRAGTLQIRNESGVTVEVAIPYQKAS